MATYETTPAGEIARALGGGVQCAVGLLILALAFLSGCAREPEVTVNSQHELSQTSSDAASSAGAELLPVRAGSHYGFIRTDGTFAIAPEFTGATSMSSGLAAVSIGGQSAPLPSVSSAAAGWARYVAMVSPDDGERVGYIDGSGHYSINPIYKCAQAFSDDGVAAAAKTLVRDQDGRDACRDWVILDASGNERPVHNASYIGPFSGGLAVAEILESRTTTTVGRAEDCTSPKARRLGACIPKEPDVSRIIETKRVGYIDSKGDQAIAAVYEGATPFSDNRAFVIRQCRAAVIDDSGELLSDFRIHACDHILGPFREGLAPAAEKVAGSRNGSYGFVNERAEFEI